MQQLTYTGPRELEWQDAPEPRLTGDGAALVRPLAVATCDLDGTTPPTRCARATGQSS